ncbi:hypothetical protein F4813DRAFT_400846 [Daldinia decipiens]|uniref:uncharacterized protein n=1 Tax=Daldinia decipiens TaxID=326647 RepID=UPI0020C52E66|nr:uncharacterized protein F4813DRAFT_400846 [Daldinia decipiens]KAI1652700.1 hypothetical protein F4813DRAFT_400846 [Daldinia decipiens]
MGNNSKGRSKERDDRSNRVVIERDDNGRAIGRQFDPYDPRYIGRLLAENRARYHSGDAQASSAPQRSRDPGPYGSSQAAYNTSLQRPQTEISPERRELHDRVTQWMQTPSFPASDTPMGGQQQQQQQYASFSSATAGYVAGPNTTAAWPTDPNTVVPSDVASYYNRSGYPSREPSPDREPNPPYNPSDVTSYYAHTGFYPSTEEKRRRADRQNQVLLYEDPRQYRREQDRERRKEKRHGKERAY